jgi:flagellar hook-basal body complex protein FliE
MNEIDPNALLVQMRAMAARAGGMQPTSEADKPDGDFKVLLRQAVDNVNEQQQSAGRLAEAFERGDPNVDIAEVMIALQKANVSFQAITQVRNRLVSAYQDIMNMPI